MNDNDRIWSVLEDWERDRDRYWAGKDPICRDRLLWQAQGFRHLVHLLPGETILELGAGRGWFSDALARVSRGRNPITAVTFDADAEAPADIPDSVERLGPEALRGGLDGRRFRYVVVQSVLVRENVAFLLGRIYDLLEDGGRAVFFESNPWTPFFAVRNALAKALRRPRRRILMNRTELYELMSEIGFIRVSAQFTDFVYAPLTPGLIWLFRNLSVLLENAPFIRTLAGRILLHAQKPPRNVPREKMPLARHAALRDAVSVVVPCHNEEMNIDPLVEDLRSLYDDYIHQIVLVDDNSTDATRAVIERLAGEDPRITPVRRTPPNGVGLALRDGYAAATGRYVLSMDCDFQHLLPELEDMFDAAAEGFDAVLGSRFSRHSLLINYPFGKILANRAFHLVANLLFRCWRRDLSNNLKLMRSDLVRRMNLEATWFAINAEIGLNLVLMRCTIKEVPISWINRTFDMGRSSFGVLQSGGGYARVLLRLARKTACGLRPLP